jgi:hypothetical protein
MRLSLTRQTRCPASVARTCATCPAQSSFHSRFIPSDASVAFATQRLSVDRRTPVRSETSLRRWTCLVVDRLTHLTLAQISAEIVHATDAGTVTLPASIAALSSRLTACPHQGQNPTLGYGDRRCTVASDAQGSSISCP